MAGKITEIRTFGTPALVRDGEVISLHNKHLALLVFLLVETRPHRPDHLRDLLWRGVDSAPVSLSKALKVVRDLAGEDSLPPRYSKSIWLKEKPSSDAFRLLEARRRAELRPEALAEYHAPFLAGFLLGTDEQGYAEWNRWVESQRERFQRLFLELSLEQAKDCIARKNWDEAGDVLQRAFDRAGPWADGEKLRAEVVRGRDAAAAARWEQQRLPESEGRAEELQEPAAVWEQPAVEPEGVGADLRPGEPPSRIARTRSPVLIPALALILLGVAALVWMQSRAAQLRRAVELRQPRNGENIRTAGGAAYLVFNRTLYQYPDAETLHACTGGHPSVVRTVATLPRWRRIMLPSRKQNPWMSGSVPLASDDRTDLTDYAFVGCVLAGIPDPQTFQVIFGHRDWERLVRVPDSLLKEVLPQVIAGAHPLLPTGTLIRGSGDEIRWIVYQGGSLGVENENVLNSHCRDGEEVLNVDDNEFRFYLKQAELQPAAAPCR